MLLGKPADPSLLEKQSESDLGLLAPAEERDPVANGHSAPCQCCSVCRWHTGELIPARLRHIDTKLDFICTTLSKALSFERKVPDNALAKMFEANQYQPSSIGQGGAIGHSGPMPPIFLDTTPADPYDRLGRLVSPVVPRKTPIIAEEVQSLLTIAAPTASSVSVKSFPLPLTPKSSPDQPSIDGSAGIPFERSNCMSDCFGLAARVTASKSTHGCLRDRDDKSIGYSRSANVTFADNGDIRGIPVTHEAFRTGQTSSRVSLERKQTTYTALAGAYQQRRGVQRKSLEDFVTSHVFDTFITGVVLLNTVLLGASVHHHAVSDHPLPAVFESAEYVCIAIYSVELMLRLCGQRGQLFHRDHRFMFALDATLVVCSWLEIAYLVLLHGAAEQIENAGLAKLLKLARMCRVLRAFRMFRFWVQIRIMVIQIAGTLNALGWFFLLLCFILYLFAVIITTGATAWLKSEDGGIPKEHSEYENVKNFYGGVPQTMYTLFMCITSGISWGEPGQAALATGELYFSVFCVFIFTGIFSVLNVITGVFVDSAIQQAEADRTVRVHHTKRHKQDMQKALNDILQNLDIDDDNYVTQQEWWLACEQPEIKNILVSLEIDGIASEDIFELLDTTREGVLRTDDFMEGLTMIRGMAKSVDVYRLHADVRCITETLNSVAMQMLPEGHAFHHQS